jgi:hypothetical protein
MIPVPDLQLGFRDAENYKRRENKDLLNRLFVRTSALDQLCEPSTFFLVGEKGAGKTAYAVYLQNNDYRHTLASLRYIRETEYAKFVELKQAKHLTLSDYTNIWRVIIYLLLAQTIKSRETGKPGWLESAKFRSLTAAIDAYYRNAFSPEIIYAIRFAEESEITAQLLSQFATAGGTEKESMSFTQNQFQTNLLYIQRQFEDALRSVKLTHSHVLFIDGIDIRPGSIPYDVYLECIKGLANAVWAANNDFFANIRDPKGRLRVVLLVRPDIFDSLGLQNQNSKLRDNSVVLNWLTTYTEYRDSPLFLMADRVLSFQQPEQCQQGEAWDHYFPFDATNLTSAQAHPSSFISLLRYSMYRPRDVLATLAVLKDDFIEQHRSATDVFKATDFLDPMFTRKYSDYLLGEVKDHLSFYFPANDWHMFLKFFHFLDGRWSFSYEEYLSAYGEFEAFLRRNKERKPAFAATPDHFLQFLFDLAILCYVADSDSEDERFFGWCFRERTATNIAPKVRTHVRYRVHFGLRKALEVGKALGDRGASRRTPKR